MKLPGQSSIGAANVNHVNNVGNSPLMLAIMYTWSEIQLISILLEHNANPFIINGRGYSPLMMAIKNERRDIEYLIRGHIYKILSDTGLSVLPRDILGEIINYL